MMRLLYLVAVLLAFVGCQDALGLGASCTAEMAGVRRSEGGSPDRTNTNRLGNDFEEQWIYDASSGRAGRFYIFSWGLSYESCEVVGPIPLDVVPIEDGHLSAWLPAGW